MNIFAYGTLIDAKIMSQVTCETYRSQKATLHHYLRKIREVYPAIIRQEGSSVDGIFYFEVSPLAIEFLDKFEGSYYQRTRVQSSAKAIHAAILQVPITTTPENHNAEVLAYLIEDHPRVGIARLAIAAIKKVLAEGFGFGFP